MTQSKIFKQYLTSESHNVNLQKQKLTTYWRPNSPLQICSQLNLKHKCIFIKLYKLSGLKIEIIEFFMSFIYVETRTGLWVHKAATCLPHYLLTMKNKRNFSLIISSTSVSTHLFLQLFSITIEPTHKNMGYLSFVSVITACN